MNTALWVAQILLGIFFVIHAVVLVRPSPERLKGRMDWVLEINPNIRMFAGTTEGFAGVALVVAPVLGPLSYLVPFAAAGLVVLMLGAIVLHLQRREYPNLGLNVTLAILAGLVAWGRFGPYHL